MPDLLSPYALEGVTPRDRIVMSPTTMDNSVGGRLDDYHVCYRGARANRLRRKATLQPQGCG